MTQFNCNHCNKQYKTKNRLSDHLFKVHSIDARKPRIAVYDCGICNSTFKQCSSVIRHLRDNHNSTKPMKCPHCAVVHGSRHNLEKRVELVHDPTQLKTKIENNKPIQFQAEQHATKNFFKSYRLNIQKQLDILAVMESFQNNIQAFL